MAPPIIIPSRGRATTGTTWKLFPNAEILVHEDEEEDYAAAGVLPRRTTLATHTELFLPEIRNLILDTTPVGTWVMVFDDDIRKVGQFERHPDKPGKWRAAVMEPADWLKALRRWVGMANKRGYHLVGVSSTTNPMNYKGRPFKTNLFIDGPCMVMRATDRIRFDVKCRVKGDYEYTALCVKKGLGVLRLDHLWLDNDYHGNMGGGCSEYRTPTLEGKACRYLIHKYPGYFRMNTRREGWEVLFRPPRRREE